MTLAPEIQTSSHSNEARLPTRRFFTRAEVDPYDELEWELRSAVIEGADGKPVFEQRDIEFPKSWSQNATNVVASKYFRGPLVPTDGMVRESSVKQLIDRVVNEIAGWGWKDPSTGSGQASYFADEEEREAFRAELKYCLVNQLLCFNAPVWFNVGQEEKPQCSACFILSIDDSIDPILDWYKTEGKIFKGGSGSGINLSKLRSSREHVTAGGLASGPVSFMRGADSVAGTIKSGGKTRRAAKMVVLNIDHPDIEEFVWSKAREERKAYALGEAGYDMSLDGDAWISIQYQNANNSVRVTDEFMRAVREDAGWQTRFVTSGQVATTTQARKLMRDIAQAAWECADPGMQYHTTINNWHTCPNTGPINASNPCSEYMHIDDSACNLASLNLMKFVNESLEFDVDSFRHAVDLLITAMDIIVDNSSYPTAEIGQNASDYRQLGLGYANLGAALMAMGLPYDSKAGREYAAAITALMHGEAYQQSARIAGAMGPVAGYAENREAMLTVIEKHRAHGHRLDPAIVPLPIYSSIREVWDETLELGRKHGYRNSQATVLAPTGTIAFMMDCDTTGVEPDIALVKYKKLVGGGLLKIVNNTVPQALKRLGYDAKEIQDIVEYIDEMETIEGAPQLEAEDLPVFDCAFKPTRGTRTIHPLGHLRMMGAVQPFISGAISKTVNMPNDVTIEEIEEAYIEAWRLGLKAVAIYRDGCKRTQPLNTGKKSAESAGPAIDAPTIEYRATRRRLPADRTAICHKVDIAGHAGYLH